MDIVDWDVRGVKAPAGGAFWGRGVEAVSADRRTARRARSERNAPKTRANPPLSILSCVPNCRCLLVQSAVWAFMVVKTKIACEAAVKRMSIGILPQIDVLIFDAAPQPFDERIIERSATTVHADADLGLG